MTLSCLHDSANASNSQRFPVNFSPLAARTGVMNSTGRHPVEAGVWLTGSRVGERRKEPAKYETIYFAPPESGPDRRIELAAWVLESNRTTRTAADGSDRGG